MAVLHDPQKNASYDAKVRAEDTESEQKETEMHAYPAEPESLPSKVKRVFRLLGALLDF
jgi:hypothetical protein